MPYNPDPAGPLNSPAEFIRGAHDVWRGAAYILAHPVLWIWALIPFVINVVFFFFLAWLLWHFGGGWLHAHFFQSGAFWAVIGWLLGVIFWAFFLLLTYFLFVPLAALVASPFNDILSEKVERLYAGQSVAGGFSLKLLIKSIAFGMHASLRLSLASLGLLLAALLLNLLPAFGSLLWSIASAAITIRFLSLQFTAYSMDRRFYTYRQRREFLARNRARTLGLGTMAFLVMLVPGLNALFIPISAVAGTLLFCDVPQRN